MAGLDPAVHVFPSRGGIVKAWMPGTRPGMTEFVLLAFLSLPRRGAFDARLVTGPAPHQAEIDVEQVEHAPERVIDHLFERLRLRIECRNRRIDDCAGLGDGGHLADVAKME